MTNDIPTLQQIMHDTFASDIGTWRLAVAVLATKETKGKELVAAMGLKSQQIREIDTTLDKMLKKARNARHAELATLEENVRKAKSQII